MAQSGIQVAENEANPQIPDLIAFYLQAESDAEIESVVLKYGTNALGCQDGGSRQPMDFDPAAAVDLSWEWDLKRSGAIPPGASLWWQWEIQDAAGNTLTTEQREVVINDNNHDWRTRQRSGVTVYWYEGDLAFAEAILTEGIRSLERLTNDIGVTPPGEIELWVYPTANSVRDAIVNVPEWTGGVAFPEYGVTIIGVAPEQLDWAAKIIPHELTHLVIGIRTFNCRGGRLTTWLNEGLARYAEGLIEPELLTELEEALANDDLPPLSSLARGFSAYSDAAGLAYTQSRQAVEHLIDSYGPDQMDLLLSVVQDGVTVDFALLEVYGFDTDGLDARWRTAVGFAPTPTSEAEAIALQATPTLVPTLALGGIPIAQASATPTMLATDSPETTTPLAAATNAPTPVPTQLPAASPTIRATAVPEPVDPAPQFPWLNWVGRGTAIVLIAVLVYFAYQKRK